MARQVELDYTYMKVAEAHAELSKAKRKKVGACIVTPSQVILAGYNGLSPGGSNELEYIDGSGNLVTKAETIHAELNCIIKAAKEGVSVIDGTLYVTLSCCLPCSEMLIAVGIKRVVYKEEYRCRKGIENLIKRGIKVEQLV